MIRRCLALLLTVSVVFVGLTFAGGEPPADPGDAPLRLKKKPKSDDNKTEPPKTTEKKLDDKNSPEKKADDKKEETTDEAAPTEPEQDEKEVMERIARNLHSVENRFANKELNEGTRQLQDDILKDIESLIRSSENPPQGGGGGGGQQEQNQSNQDQSNGQNGQGKQGSSSSKNGQQKGISGPGSLQGGSQGQTTKGQSRGKGRQRGQLARGHQRGKLQLRPGSEQPNTTEQASGKNGQNPTENSGGGKSSGELNPNADLYKDVWGHLPESLRAEMNAYAGRQEFMAKHEALIKKYYSTIAAEGRRKGDKP